MTANIARTAQSQQVPHFDQRCARIKLLTPELQSIAKKHGTPRYVFDPAEALANSKRFEKAFESQGLPIEIFYAVKSNPYPGLLRVVTKAGHGLDVSSKLELDAAIDADSTKIIFTGPGKTDDELAYALTRHPNTTFYLESLAEFSRLSSLARAFQQTAKCAIRVFTSAQKEWSKFGVSLSELPEFWKTILEDDRLIPAGIHFHISFNDTADSYVTALRELGKLLKEGFSKKGLTSIDFIDIGGGMWPEGFEGTYPWNEDQNIQYSYPKGVLEKILGDKFEPRIHVYYPDSIEQMASDVVEEFKSSILSLNSEITLRAQPGRFISHSTIHFLFQVVEVYKDRKCVIVDGGTNMIGWEKQQWVNYTPIFNLNSFSSSTEQPCLVYGSLCTANDLWGYYIYGSNTARPGDLLVLPYQGAYTLALAQQFIKGIPEVSDLDHVGSL